MNNFCQKTLLKGNKKSFIVFLFLFALLSVQQVNAETLTIKQGEILFYPINSETNTSAYFGGEKISIFNYDGHNYALVMVDVNKKLGNYYLRIKTGTQETERKIIRVKRGSYKQVVKGVPYKFGTLSKEKQESVAKDKAPLSALLTKAEKEVPARLWQSVFRSPLNDINITSPFGYKRIYTNHSTVHQGVDLKAEIGTPVYAISDGEILWGEEKSLYLEGPLVVINHGDGIISKYLHLSKVLVQTGSMIHAGDIIGYSGDQGADVTGPHLHFAIKVRNASINPLQFIEEFQKLKNKQSL